MPIMPAVCNNCGAIFPSSFHINNSTNISFSGCIDGPCPVCGGLGHIPDGVYNFVGNAIEILNAPQRTIEELNRFAEILRAAQESDATPEQVGAEIQNEIPELYPLLKFLKNDDFRFWLTTFLAILGILLPMFQKDEPKDKPTINQTIEVEQVINNIYQINQNVPSTIPSSAPTSISVQPVQQQVVNKPIRYEKIGRNKPCPCGSGMKYKRCHGQ